MKFLIDECLSPDLVAIARDRGFSLSTHVTWLGLRSKKRDWTIVRRAIEDGYVLVTNNTTDFTSLAGREDVEWYVQFFDSRQEFRSHHPPDTGFNGRNGLPVLEPGLTRQGCATNL